MMCLLTNIILCNKLFTPCSSILLSTAYQSNNAINSSSTVMIEGTLSDSDMVSAELTTEDTIYNSHKLLCTRKEHREVGCLNGKCFAVDLQPRVAGCA